MKLAVVVFLAALGSALRAWDVAAPTPVLNNLRWSASLAFLSLGLFWASRYLKPGIALVLVGASLNAAVTIANGGVMPVIGVESLPAGHWVVADEGHHLLWAADRYRGFSLGDIIITAGWVLSLGGALLWWRQNRRAKEPAKSLDTVPSLGVH